MINTKGEVLFIILLILIIISVSKGNKKKNLEIQKLEEESNQLSNSEITKESISIADELIKLKELKDNGVLTDKEVEDQKAKLLNK